MIDDHEKETFVVVFKNICVDGARSCAEGRGITNQSAPWHSFTSRCMDLRHKVGAARFSLTSNGNYHGLTQPPTLSRLYDLELNETSFTTIPQFDELKTRLRPISIT